MTTFAGNGNTFVIKHPSGKLTGVMTHPAILGGGNVRSRLAYGGRTIMAGCAIAGDVHMIKDRWSKRCGGMAQMTVLGGWHMVCRRFLTRSILTVVTTFASTGNALVIKHTGGETGGVMTHPAILGGGNVRGRFTHSRRTVMAASAITGDVLVIENRWNKRRG